MKVIIQVVDNASVEIAGNIYNQVEHGYLMYVGINQNDKIEDVHQMVNKIAKLRICPDQNGKINKNGLDDNREILSISQFTLYANFSEGNRPSFTDAKKPDEAELLYLIFNQKLEESGFTVKPGVFGAEMKISSLNNGPLTFVLENNKMD
ncbi:D-aminoacyl-tRNA deacylase [Mollicutes bacterium LVI A0039]|nr:D-aminoacyl-tRNA deacylase [Mollicutes bacterium LVI A0039]